MKYHKQLYRHNPEIGEFGDCYRTCLACILDCSPNDVPNFGESFAKGEEWQLRIMQWMREVGVGSFQVAFECGLENVLATTSLPANRDALVIVTGKTERGFSHCVIAHNGKIIHDPHPDNTGLSAPASDGYYWIELILPEKFLLREVPAL